MSDCDVVFMLKRFQQPGDQITGQVRGVAGAAEQQGVRCCLVRAQNPGKWSAETRTVVVDQAVAKLLVCCLIAVAANKEGCYLWTDDIANVGDKRSSLIEYKAFVGTSHARASTSRQYEPSDCHVVIIHREPTS